MTNHRIKSTLANYPALTSAFSISFPNKTNSHIKILKIMKGLPGNFSFYISSIISIKIFSKISTALLNKCRLHKFENFPVNVTINYS